MNKESSQDKNNTELPSDSMTSKCKWSFHAGGQEDEEEDDDDCCWETTISTVPVDSDSDDLSLNDHDEFAEDVVEDIPAVSISTTTSRQTKISSSSSSPHTPPPKATTSVQSHYRQFQELSQLSCKMTTPTRLTQSACPRSTRRKAGGGHSGHRDLIKESMKHLLDF